MPIIESLVVKFDADFSALDKSFGKAERRATESGKKIARVGGLLTAGVTIPLLALGAAAVKASSDAEEAGAKFDVVFGQSTQRATKRIAELHDTIPLATAEMVDMAAGIQDLVKPLGLVEDAAADVSLQTLELAGDLASFNNVRIDEVLLAIRSGFVGQSEPLLRFGADVRVAAVKAKALELGLMSLNGTLSNAARVQSVLAIVTESNTDALGDAARTADSTANSIKFLVREVKDLGDTIGDILVPVVRPMIRGLTSALELFGDLPRPVQEGVVVLAAMAAAVGPLVLVMGGLIAALPLVATGLAAVSAAGIGLLPLLAGAAGIIAAVGVVTVGLMDMARALKAADDDLEGFTGTAEEFRREVELLLFAPEGETELERQLREARIEMDRIRNLPPIDPPIPPTTIALLEITAENLELLEERADSLADSIADARMDLQFEQDTEKAQELTAEIAAMADELERVNEAIARQLLGGAGVTVPRDRLPGPRVDTSPAARRALRLQVSSIAAGLRPLSEAGEESADNLGKVAMVARRLGPELGELGRVASGVIGSFTTGGFLGAGAALGAELIGAIGGLFGPSRDIIAENTEAIRRNTAAIQSTLRGEAGGLLGAGIKGLQEGLAEFAAGSPGFEAVEALVDELERAGFSMEQFRELMDELGIELVGSPEGFQQALDLLTGDLFSSLEGALELAKRRIALLDITDPAAQFAEIKQALAGALPGGVSGLGFAVGRLGPDTIEAFAAGILDQIAAGTFDFTRLGPDVSVDAFLDAIGELESLADAAGEASDALGDVAGIVNQPSGFKVALERFRASDPVSRGIGTVDTGGRRPRPGGLTIGEITINVGDGQEATGRRIVDELRDELEREAALGGADVINLAVVEV